MENKEITALLKANESLLSTLFDETSPEFWVTKPEGKWTAGQHVIHLVQSSKPLLKALQMPNFLLKWRFGKSNRPSRSYDEVVKRYKEKLALSQGVVGPFSLNMPASDFSEAKNWLTKLYQLNDGINKITLKLKDKDMDTILLPHPLMGKMTLREILMWNAYHTLHHLEVLKEKYIPLNDEK
ncbi:MAG: DinB family protein [Saprospiraceae bacterium]|nr:DinB family protein [Saprospiraceae bacterium]